MVEKVCMCVWRKWEVGFTVQLVLHLPSTITGARHFACNQLLSIKKMENIAAP